MRLTQRVAGVLFGLCLLTGCRGNSRVVELRAGLRGVAPIAVTDFEVHGNDVTIRFPRSEQEECSLPARVRFERTRGGVTAALYVGASADCEAALGPSVTGSVMVRSPFALDGRMVKDGYLDAARDEMSRRR